MSYVIELHAKGGLNVLTSADMLERNLLAAKRGEHTGWMPVGVRQSLEEAWAFELEVKRARRIRAEGGNLKPEGGDSRP